MYRRTNNFIFKVGVEISDHPLTVDQSQHYINIVIQMGSLILQGNLTLIVTFIKRNNHFIFKKIAERKDVTVLRTDTAMDRMTIVRPFLQFTPVVQNYAVYQEK